MRNLVIMSFVCFALPCVAMKRKADGHVVGRFDNKQGRRKKRKLWREEPTIGGRVKQRHAIKEKPVTGYQLKTIKQELKDQTIVNRNVLQRLAVVEHKNKEMQEQENTIRNLEAIQISILNKISKLSRRVQQQSAHVASLNAFACYSMPKINANKADIMHMQHVLQKNGMQGVPPLLLTDARIIIAPQVL